MTQLVKYVTKGGITPCFLHDETRRDATRPDLTHRDEIRPYMTMTGPDSTALYLTSTDHTQLGQI